MIEKLTAMIADIDLTLCNKGEPPMPRTIAALQRLHREGVLFGPATGRPMDRRILDLARQWGLGFDFDLAIGMNGGDIWIRETNTIEHYYQLKKETVRSILSMICHMDLNAIVYVNGYDEINALRMDDFLRDSQRRNKSIVEVGDVDFVSRHDTGKIECHLKPQLKQEFMSLVNANKSDDWITVITYENDVHVTIEFVDPHVNKGMGLVKYAEMADIPLSEIMTFGDLENDIGLLKEAGWGVCMINGSADTKAAADDITDYSVFEDGVGRYLEDHWWNRK